MKRKVQMKTLLRISLGLLLTAIAVILSTTPESSLFGMMVALAAMPSISRYDNYDTIFPGKKEVIGHTYWDTITYVSGTTTAAVLFNAVRATKDLGNLETASQIPAGSHFVLRAARFFPKSRPRSITVAATANFQTGVFDNVAQLINTGVATLTVGNKKYFEVPLWMLPAGGGVTGTANTGDIDVAIDYAINGIADPRAVYSFSQPLIISPQINFHVDLFWPAAITLVDSVNITVCLALDGDIIRPVQ